MWVSRVDLGACRCLVVNHRVSIVKDIFHLSSVQQLLRYVALSSDGAFDLFWDLLHALYYLYLFLITMVLDLHLLELAQTVRDIVV